MNSEIGKLIKAKRKEMRYTAFEVSRSVGISQSFLSNIENGWFLPSWKMALKIAKHLEIPERMMILALMMDKLPEELHDMIQRVFKAEEIYRELFFNRKCPHCGKEF